MTMKHPPTCLSADSLRQLPRANLPPAELPDIAQHLIECPHFLDLLDCADSGSLSPDEIISLLTPSTRLPPPHRLH